MNYYIKIIIFTFLNFNIYNSLFSQVVINEFMASNAMTFPDIVNYEDFPDWIELYNTTNKSLDISGWYLTDNLNNTEKFKIPEGSYIPANGYKIIFASGYEGSFTGFYYLHSNFKLSQDGEEIGLFNSNGQIIDSIIYGYQLTDISWGRKPDGGDNWCYFGEPTPNEPNTSPRITVPEYTAAPIFSKIGGFYNTPIEIIISTPTPNATIHFTTDCSVPTRNSLTYETPLTIDSTTIIRARVFKTNFLPGEIVSQTYFFNEINNNLPTISLISPPNFLWDKTYGIYENSIRSQSIPANFEYFDNNNNRHISQITDIRITGQASHQAPQKPFTISAKGKYGTDALNYPFFKTRNLNSFQDIYLRNSGTPDAFFTMFRDALTHSIMINNMDIECMAYQPTQLFLNGEYWGIYNIREKINENFLNNHHNVNTDNLNILEYEFTNGINIVSGKSDDYENLLDFIKELPIENPKNYAYLKSKIDIDELINYQIAEIYIDNIDWGSSNMKWWNENTYNSKWRFILLDTDVSYGLIWHYGSYQSYYYHDNLIRALEGTKQSYLFSRLIKNKEFKNEFISRFAAHLNTTFDSTRTVKLLDSLQQNIYNEMPRHIERWKNSYFSHYGPPLSNIEDWESKVEIMREFARQRPTYQRHHIIQNFHLNGMDSLTTEVSAKQSGAIYINDIYITDSIDSGIYFHNIPIRIKAVPKLGYKFKYWEGDFSSSKADTFLTLNNKMQIKAVFEQINLSIVPNEINNIYTLYKAQSPYYSNGNIIVQANATLKIEAGVELNMSKDACILVYGKIEADGTKTDRIILTQNSPLKTHTWGNICFENGTGKSYLKNTTLNKSTINKQHQKHIANISAYQTNLLLDSVIIVSKVQPFYSEYGEIEIKNCYFHSDIASDLINIKYAELALVEKSKLTGNETIDADAIDYDNLNGGIIRSNYISGFIGFNSDGIDLGENAQNIIIENNIIFNCADKGISIGQASTAKVKNNIIAYCNQGLGIKDSLSYAEITNNTFYGNSYAVACFEKNFRNGGGKAKLTNCIIRNSIKQALFFDELSEIKANYTLTDSEFLPGEGNLNNNPLFENEDALNFQLSIESPCINAGDPLGDSDPDGSIADMGAKPNFKNSIEELVIINEINYNSDSLYDSQDWIELYNTTNHTVDLSGWSFMDENYDHIFTLPDGIKMAAHSYFVLCRNDSSFKAIHPYISNYYGSFVFGLSNNNELLRLFNANMQLVNSTHYYDVAPWPTEANGQGYTLELISEDLDNSKVENWRKSPFLLGSPGNSNNPTIAADFEYTVYSDCSGLVYFQNTTDAPIDSIIWNFGDNNFSKEENPHHAYQEPGNFKVSLTVYSYFGTNTKSTSLNFVNTLPQPKVIGDTACDNGILTLQAFGTETVYWFNNIDDTDPFYTGSIYTTDFLESSETYYVSNNIDECESNRVAVEAKIYNDPLSYFIFDINNGLISTKNASLNADKYFWEFGDGNTSSEFEPIYQYKSNGIFNLSLTVENTYCGLSSKTSRTVEVIMSNIIAHEEFNPLIIYPNPSNGLINFRSNFETKETTVIEIYNLRGTLFKTVYINKLNTHTTLNFSEKDKGIYLFKTTHGNYKNIDKIVIQ